MKSKEDENRQGMFFQALQGKKIPVLTLDNKWYRLLTEENRTEADRGGQSGGGRSGGRAERFAETPGEIKC